MSHFRGHSREAESHCAEDGNPFKSSTGAKHSPLATLSRLGAFPLFFFFCLSLSHFIIFLSHAGSTSEKLWWHNWQSQQFLGALESHVLHFLFSAQVTEHPAWFQHTFWRVFNANLIPLFKTVCWWGENHHAALTYYFDLALFPQ